MVRTINEGPSLPSEYGTNGKLLPRTVRVRGVKGPYLCACVIGTNYVE